MDYSQVNQEVLSSFLPVNVKKEKKEQKKKKTKQESREVIEIQGVEYLKHYPYLAHLLLLGRLDSMQRYIGLRHSRLSLSVDVDFDYYLLLLYFVKYCEVVAAYTLLLNYAINMQLLELLW